MNKNKTVVFLGPSLDKEVAQAILPDALFLPPVRCGDVLRVLRLNPLVIAIIDGGFETSAAVWHKELLLALEKGVTVYGAASMGALRAAELHQFGMLGMGTIFEQYASGKINDDDEVAVLQAPRESNFIALSDAMVNVRATLNAAVKEEVVTDSLAQAIIKDVKNIPYQERKLKKFVHNKLGEKKLTKESENDLRKLHEWLEKGGFVDQKRLDAVALLEHLADEKIRLCNKGVVANRSLLLRGLINEVMCRPFHESSPLLPQTERVAMAARLLGENYLFLRRLACFWAAAYALAQSRLQKFDKELVLNVEDRVLIDKLGNEADWCLNNDINSKEQNEFLRRLELVEKFAVWQKNNRVINKVAAQGFTNQQDFMQALVELASAEGGCADIVELKSSDPLRYKIFELTAYFWHLLDVEAQHFNLYPAPDKVQEFMNRFRMQHNLISKEQVEAWFETSGLDMQKTSILFAKTTLIHFLVLQGHLDVIDAWQKNDNIFWLLDMLRLTGGYSLAKDSHGLLKNLDVLDVKDDNAAFELDFVYGYTDFKNYIDRL